MGAAAVTPDIGGGTKFFRGGPLDFSLTSSGLALTGKTNSKAELMAFVERLKALAAVLPDTPKEDDGYSKE